MSTILVKKNSMGFRSASQRRACKNCINGLRMPSPDVPTDVTWRCEKGGFLVSAMAVCNQHEAREVRS